MYVVLIEISTKNTLSLDFANGWEVDITDDGQTVSSWNTILFIRPQNPKILFYCLMIIQKQHYFIHFKMGDLQNSTLSSTFRANFSLLQKY